MSAIVGLDLSLTSTGICSIEDAKIDVLHNIKTAGKKDDDLLQRHARIDAIAYQIRDFIHESYTDLVVVEGPSYGSRGGSAHDRAGLWWMVVDDCLKNEIPVAVVWPTTRAMYGTGRGNASKDDVFAETKARYQPLTTELIANDDIADATLLAAMGSRALGHPIEATEPSDKHLRALEGVLWPSVQV